MMKAETTRRLVVDHTKREMIRQGISRLTMDIIAQGLGMSKRTLYQLFPSKVCLVQICLADIGLLKFSSLAFKPGVVEYCVKNFLLLCINPSTLYGFDYAV